MRRPVPAGPLLAALGYAAAATAAGPVSPAPPKAPFIRTAACPLECCAYGTWTARVPLQAYQRAARTAPKAFSIGTGETFQAEGGDLWTEQLGFVMVLRPFQKQGRRFEPGDIFYILSYQAWDYLIWQRGQVLGVPAFWGTGDPDRETALLKAEPAMVWWVRVKNAAGVTGWIPLRLQRSTDGMTVAEEINGMNDCG
jgi:hypothetical protein